MSVERPRRLGRGLEALIPTLEAAAPAAPSELQRIPIARIRANPFQPRREFAEADLAELEASLRSSGLLQPITVRRRGDAYELIAGERRLRAATRLGWTEITAIVREFDDQTMLVLALVENLQRANLNAIEEARGYRRLIDDFALTQQQVADAVGKDRTTITNLLRLLSLPATVQEMVEQGMLSSGHARALLALGADGAPLAMAEEAVAHGWSVRELEQRVRELGIGKTGGDIPGAGPTKKAGSGKPADPAVRALEDDLRRHLQTDVHIHVDGGDRGRIELSFYSGEDFERILDLILGDKRRDF